MHKLSDLKFRYKFLTEFVAGFAIFPAALSMYLWLPILESAEENYSKNIVFVGFIVIYLLQAVTNYLIVAFFYRRYLERKLGISKEESKSILWRRWYPEHWLKNGA